MEFYAKNYDLLTSTERDLLHFILDNEAQVEKSTATKIANACGVSKTVVINMCQKLGFEGFNELKYYLKNREKNQKTMRNLSPNLVQSALEDIVSKTLHLNNEKMLKEVSKKICDASCVYVISRGTSKAVGVYFTHLLLTLNIKCINIPDYNLLSIIAKKMTHDEVLIALSLSGETPIIVDTAKMVKAYGNSLITVTAFANSTLCSYSDYTLYFCSNKLDTKYEDIVSRLGMFTIVDYLVSYINEELNNRNKHL